MPLLTYKMAKRHTWQVAMQVAAGKALCYAEQLRRKGRRVTISLPSATTARDLQPTRPGETRPKTSQCDFSHGPSLQRLQREAGAAARSGDLHTQVSVPGRAIHAIPFWDELRTWDPGD